MHIANTTIIHPALRPVHAPARTPVARRSFGMQRIAGSGARPGTRQQQRGVTILAVLLGLVVAGVVGMGIVEKQALQHRIDVGRAQGDLLLDMRQATNMYVLENYPQLQLDQSVTRNGVTLAAGVNDGQSFRPSVQDLINLGYLREGTTDLSRVNNGRYRVKLEKIPVGCVGVDCDVHGAVYIDRPILEGGGNTGDPDGVVIGQTITTVGGDALFTAVAHNEDFLGMNGTVMPNPVAGNPYGIVGARVGYGSSAWGRFLVVGDPRDPNFQGDMTVHGDTNIGGDTHIGGNTTVVGDIGSGEGADPGGSKCTLAAILNSGQVVTRTAECVTRTWMRNDGEIGIATETGTQTIRITGANGGSGMTVSRNDGSTGAYIGNRHPTIPADLHSQVFGDSATVNQIRANNADGTGASYMTSLQVGANTTNFRDLNMRREETVGAACTMPEVDPNLRASFHGTDQRPDGPDLKPLAIGHLGSKPVLLTCDVATNTWQPVTGQTIGTVGGHCDTPGSSGVTDNGLTLICSNNNTWVSMEDRLSKWAVKGSVQVRHNDLVAQPICPAGSKALIYEIPQVIDGTNYVSNFYARPTLNSWRIFIIDGQGAALPQAKAIAQIGCWFD